MIIAQNGNFTPGNSYREVVKFGVRHDSLFVERDRPFAAASENVDGSAGDEDVDESDVAFGVPHRRAEHLRRRNTQRASRVSQPHRVERDSTGQPATALARSHGDEEAQGLNLVFWFILARTWIIIYSYLPLTHVCSN